MTEVQGEMSELIGHIAHPLPVLARSNEQHAELVAALDRRDGWAAAHLVREHLKGTEQVLAGLCLAVIASTQRPLIGICTALERARFGVWDADAVPARRAATSRPCSAPAASRSCCPPDPDVDPDRLLDVLDGLILAGGRDIDPATYGAEPHPAPTSAAHRARRVRARARARGRWSATSRCWASAAGCS